LPERLCYFDFCFRTRLSDVLQKVLIELGKRIPLTLALSPHAKRADHPASAFL
jgi:hypothetical protein